MRIRLNHTCNHPRCSGLSGDVLDLPEEWAAYLLGRGGAVRVEPEPAQPAKPVPVESEQEPGQPADSPQQPIESARAAARRRRG